jgi:DNA-binding transcriptional MerR regulator
MNHPPRFYSPIETAKRLGITTKTLRYYEARGLIRPLRASNGWRTYGPIQMAQLHQVLALKRLGLSLERIAELMKGQLGGIAAVLDIQEIFLRRRLVDTGRALDLLLAAKRKLENGDQLSSDDLLNLTKETVMSDQISKDEASGIVQDLYEKHISAEERERLRANGYEPMGSSAVWETLHAEAAILMAKGDPGTPEAMDLARRWMDEVNRATGGDPSLNQKVRAMWKEALQSPAVEAQTPSTSLEMMNFIGEAYGKALAAGVAS